MSIVSETVISYLPAKRKTTPSGWISFSGPCCIHNGESQDTKQRAGFIENRSLHILKIFALTAG